MLELQRQASDANQKARDKQAASVCVVKRFMFTKARLPIQAYQGMCTHKYAFTFHTCKLADMSIIRLMNMNMQADTAGLSIPIAMKNARIYSRRC